MNDWLGFSLTPHPQPFPREDDGGGGGDDGCYSEPCNSPSMAVMPLTSDGGLSLINPSPAQGWRFENGDDGGGRPKLEDFLGGGCYSTTAKEDDGGDGINVNIPPSSHYQEYRDTDDDIVGSRDAADCYFSTPPPPPPPPPPPCLLYYGYPYYTTAADQTCLIPTTTNSSHGPYDGAITPLSEFKSWLRQPSIPPPSSSAAVQPSRDEHQQPDSDDQDVNNNYHECLSLAVTPVNSINPMPPNSPVVDNRKRGVQTKTSTKSSKGDVAPRKSIDSFGQRTSRYRGVTRHRWTGRYEAHLWDNSCRKEGQTRKGRQGNITLIPPSSILI